MEDSTKGESSIFICIVNLERSASTIAIQQYGYLYQSPSCNCLSISYTIRLNKVSMKADFCKSF